jgi:hypothetical protein
MGSRTYDFLTDSFLFDSSLIEEEFSSVNETDISRELRHYREFCLSIVAEVYAEISSDPSSLKVFSGIKRVHLDLLKQSAFYIHQHVLYDPLFPFTNEHTNQSEAFAQAIGLGDTSLDKAELAKTIKYLKALTPMVAADYVKLLPTSYFFEAPAEVPIVYSANGFADRVPGSLLKFFRDRAVVRSGKQGKGCLLFDGTFERSRIIDIGFKEHDPEDGMGYSLLDMKVLEKNPDHSTAEVSMYLPDDIPDQDRFDAWVSQSVNQTAGHVYQRLLVENSLAVKFGASYLSGSPFVFELLQQIVPIENDIQTNTMNCLINMELNFLDDVDIETLMKIRREEGEAFQNFRTELDKQLRDLRRENDAEARKIKLESVTHELFQVQVPQINSKLDSIKKKFLAESAIVAGSLYGAVQTGGWTIPVALVVGVQGYKSLNEFRRQQKENPTFFLWKVLKASKKV